MRKAHVPRCGCGHARAEHCRPPLPEPAWCRDPGPCRSGDGCRGYRPTGWFDRLTAFLQR